MPPQEQQQHPPLSPRITLGSPLQANNDEQEDSIRAEGHHNRNNNNKNGDTVLDNRTTPWMWTCCCWFCNSSHSNMDETLLLELRQQFRTALPALWGMVLYKIPWLVSLHFVGGIGSHELAAAALASTLCNVTGLSLSVGLSSALTTLAGQARGNLLSRESSQDEKTTITQEEPPQQEGDGGAVVAMVVDVVVADNQIFPPTLSYDQEMAAATEQTLLLSPKAPGKQLKRQSKVLLPLVYLYRGLFLQLLFVIPVGCWWLMPGGGVEQLLLRLGQRPVLSQMTATYLKVLTPGFWSYSINWTLTAWLQAMEMADVPAYAAAFGLIFHVPLNYLFVHILKWGYLGVGAATICFQMVQPLCIGWYVFGTRHGQARVLQSMAALGQRTSLLSLRDGAWQEIRLACGSLQGIAQYLGLALPGIVIISEWWASECVIFLSGRLQPLPDIAIGAMTIYQSINTFCFMFPVATSIAGSTRVGNLLGAGKTSEAAFASRVSVALAACVAGCLGCLLWFTPHTSFPSFFTTDVQVVTETARVIPLLAVYVFADGIQSSLNGIIKGCGRQVVTMPIVVFAYWIVGVPLSYYLAFVRNGGNMFKGNYRQEEDRFGASAASGVVGLVLGMTVGTWVHMILLGIIVVGPIQFDQEARRAKARVEAHRHYYCDDEVGGSMETKTGP